MSSHGLKPLPKDETVILVHGIWMQGWMLGVLAWRLRRYGYQTRCVSYPFLSATPKENSAKLEQALASVTTSTVHWAPHSLGGIVWLHLVNSGATLPPGRTVLLGSPVRGSRVASRMHAKRWLRPLLGKSVEQGILGGAPLNIGNRSVALIRGGGWFSVSRLLMGDKEPSDGVVWHTETELDGAADMTEVPRSHSIMIFSGLTARKAAEFFANGEFSNTG